MADRIAELEEKVAELERENAALESRLDDVRDELRDTEDDYESLEASFQELEGLPPSDRELQEIRRMIARQQYTEALDYADRLLPVSMRYAS